MSWTVNLVNLTEKAVTIGQDQSVADQPNSQVLPPWGEDQNLDTHGPLVVSIDIDDLGPTGRRDLQLLLSSGSVITTDEGPGTATGFNVTNIALGKRARVGAVRLDSLVVTGVAVSDLGYFGRRDLINLLASGCLVSGSADFDVVNISSKVVRIGTHRLPPERDPDVEFQYRPVLELLQGALTAAERRDLQHYLAAGQVLTVTD